MHITSVHIAPKHSDIIVSLHMALEARLMNENLSYGQNVRFYFKICSLFSGTFVKEFLPNSCIFAIDFDIIIIIIESNEIFHTNKTTQIIQI